MAGGAQQKHFVAVHGVGHGAWVYYKLKPLMEAAGHRFTPVSLAAAGNDGKKLEEVRSLHDYTTPLLEALASVPEGEKVILIGHSGGGYPAAYAMEKYPEKISVAVFLNALMPDSKNRPSYVIDEYLARTPPQAWMDTQFPTYGDPPITALVVGPKFITESPYNLSPIEDQALGHLSVRPGSLFMEDLATMDKFSDEKFGSVPRVYVIGADDKTIPPEFQRWLIQNNPVKEVMEIKGADHMPMFTQPDALSSSPLCTSTMHRGMPRGPAQSAAASFPLPFSPFSKMALSLWRSDSVVRFIRVIWSRLSLSARRRVAPQSSPPIICILKICCIPWLCLVFVAMIFKMGCVEMTPVLYYKFFIYKNFD